ncbi:cytochrome P450 [Globomyces pollinis-pini]|nr:cytochrome P450 [Globomyces pollinis-pini]
MEMIHNYFTNEQLTGLALVFGTAGLWSYLKRRHLPPGPMALPIIGSVEVLKHSLNDTFHELMSSTVKVYGPIVNISEVFGHVYIAVNDADECKRLLTDTTTFVRPDDFSKATEGIMDHALFVYPTNEVWKTHRKLLQPAFGPSHLRHAARVSVETTKELMEIWSPILSKQDHVVVNLKEILVCVTLDIIGKVAFGETMNAVKNATAWKELEVMTKDIYGIRSITPKFLWGLFGVSNSAPFLVKARNAVYEKIDGFSEKRLQQIRNKDIEQKGWQMDVLQRLLLSREQGLLTDEEIRGEMIGFFLAGHETTSNTLTFVFYELAKNAHILDKLYEEVSNIDLDVAESSIMEVLPKQKYLDNVLREVQRLYSIVPMTDRKNTKPVNVLGYDFPPNTHFLVNFCGMHVHEKYYTLPLEFNPDRWDKPVHPNAYMPFSDGPHNCIGQKMSVIEAKIVIIKLVQNYRFEILSDKPLKIGSDITTHLKELPMKITKR